MKVGDEFSLDGGKTYLTVDDIRQLYDLMDNKQKAEVTQLPERWLEAYQNPECFYCGRELPFNEKRADELPHERICERRHGHE